LVADDVGELRNLGLDRPPWVGRDLAGLIDFPGFTVPPGTRRGVAPDAAAEAFVRALDGVVPMVEAEIKRLERERGGRGQPAGGAGPAARAQGTARPTAAVRAAGRGER